MWVITVYLNDNKMIMYEFDTEEEGRNAFKKTQGCKILSEIVYFSDADLALAVY
jgi:hypothetical protein